ncbi:MULTISPECIES: methyl-accepting chemotaxis protein [unclassified Colwellia]|uniref:methyl-accepting chemotaxis protein n=1 Tax=unclassified Colwellia TaxID=196834 RepID=UPI0015F3ECB3|nr:MULTISPECIES: HAMP domain-containing methyl-accepting chemotaxis protein [unclassified Colwellia]MBA6232120.1 methyl-accepting chemotaxis protein [Colwellia sp. MB02u-7]MBA6237182.1 methyl-accepting chemotaxis protein [Colwellia sp. MB02u-11]MBA6257386.1 methyl-accepting chemotaxis protein [Colwellia sp. MB3u-28]MBA6260458.1 methyl-accepting chemotaxis protein [Colwellia sp. MB3u-41]MBA6301554.1 methyl-accepting chemotaxis protein [Colwellia sp. MB3u-22]
MNFFKSLPIFHKILAILAIAILSFAINLLINITAISKNQIVLKTIQNTTIHLVNLTSENVSNWQRIDEIYNQSVSFGDEELIAQATQLVTVLADNLKRISSLESSFSDTSKSVSLSKEYNDIARNISIGFINEEIDFQATATKNSIEKKSDIFKQVTEILVRDKEKAAEIFNRLVEETVTNSSESRDLSILVGILLLIIMSLLSIVIARSISHSVLNIDASLKELAEGDGDLTNQIEVTSQDELGNVVKHFNAFTQILRSIVSNVIDVVPPLTKSAEQLTDKVRDVHENVQSQAEVAEITKQSMVEMQFSVTDIAKSAAEAANAAGSGEVEVNRGMENVQRSLCISGELVHEIGNAADVVDRLAKDSQNMNKILDVINGIAEQTNLLALNAAIEAARAGEQGRGFAVVADEVRSLASRTALSTTEIRGLLDKLISAADQSVSTMGLAREKANNNEEISLAVDKSLTKIKEQIGHISSMNSQIATATEEQSCVAETVVNNIEQMYNSFGATQAAIEEIGNVAHLVDKNAVQLQTATSKFKV